MSWPGLCESDNIKQMITLTVITLSGAYCTLKCSITLIGFYCGLATLLYTPMWTKSSSMWTKFPISKFPNQSCQPFCSNKTNIVVQGQYDVISFAQAILLAQKYGAHSLNSVQDILCWHLTCATLLLATMLGVSMSPHILPEIGLGCISC